MWLEKMAFWQVSSSGVMWQVKMTSQQLSSSEAAWQVSEEEDGVPTGK